MLFVVVIHERDQGDMIHAPQLTPRFLMALLRSFTTSMPSTPLTLNFLVQVTRTAWGEQEELGLLQLNQAYSACSLVQHPTDNIDISWRGSSNMVSRPGSVGVVPGGGVARRWRQARGRGILIKGASQHWVVSIMRNSL
jgi:hypothetical protein